MDDAARDDPAFDAILPSLPPGFDHLTERELQVIRILSVHNRPTEIAAQLDIAPATVRTHIANARAKLGGITAIAAARLLAIAEGRSKDLGRQDLGMPGEVGFDPSITGKRRRILLRLFRKDGELGNDLSTIERLVAIVVAACIITTGFSVLASGGSLVSDIFRALGKR
ncbi:MAG: helix-turn-helix transcriptional regulator [Pseudomonadota bacterium]